MAKEGDTVKLTTEKETVEGVLIPSTKNEIVVLKLENGYNVGFPRKEVKELVVVKEHLPAKLEKKEIVKVEELPTIAILHTGGTIASKVDYSTGGVSAKFTASDLLAMFPELGKVANIETYLIANMMSEDVGFSEHQKIAKAVKEYATKVDGIIVGHGTDTLAVTAAALAFMFEELPIPVILVGSQRSSDRGSTDAVQNLVCAAEFIKQTDFAGVAVCMHETSNDTKCAILPATKTRKMHTSRRDAFKVINGSPIAVVDYTSRKVEFIAKEYPKKGKCVLKSNLESSVGLLKTYPNISTGLFKFFTSNYKGFVIEGTGLGHAPTNFGDNVKNYELLKAYIEKGGIVAITSQCLFGAVNPNVYTNLRRLAEIGCVFCHDMLPETAYVKLAWLLGNNSADETKKLLGENLRGEINPNLAYKEDYLND